MDPGSGQSAHPPAARRVVQGLEPFTFDTVVPGALTLRVLSSPHAHARITAIDTADAEAVEGVVAVFTHRDAPPTSVLERPARASGGRSGGHPPAR